MNDRKDCPMNDREACSMNDRDACHGFFKENKGFKRAFVLMRRKWESLGRTAGTVKLTGCSEEERRAMESLLGRSCMGKDILFSLNEFEKALGETRFRGISLKELLELYFGEPMVSNHDRKLAAGERQKDFFIQIRDAFIAKADRCSGYLRAARWIDSVSNEKLYGYYTIISEWEKDALDAEKLVNLVGKGLCHLDELDRENGDSVLLAVLAAKVSGNPHFFDRGTTGGMLLTQALCHGSGSLLPADANEFAALYLENGIQLDELSSTVTAYGVHIEKHDGRLHPAYEGFIREKEPYVIMQTNLEHAARAYGDGKNGDGKKVFVVENEMVFSYLCASVRNSVPFAALVCTSGQPRKAGYQLLDLLVRSGMELYYAGDLDPDGLRIADRLWERYEGHFHLWHMTPEDYQKAISGEEIGARGIAKLEKLVNTELKETAKQIAEQKRAGYQEQLLESMVHDLMKEGNGSVPDTGRKLSKSKIP